MPWYLLIVLSLQGQPVVTFQVVQPYDTEEACKAKIDDAVAELKPLLIEQNFPGAEDGDYQGKCEQNPEEDKDLPTSF